MDDIMEPTNGHAEEAGADYNDAFPALPGSGAAASRDRDTEIAWAALRPPETTEVFTIPIEEARYKSISESVNNTSKEVREIQKETNTVINLSMSKDRSLTVLITGKRKDIPIAKKLLLNRLQTQAMIELRIPIAHHPALIGKGGDKLKQLSNKYSVNIRIPKASENSEIVQIIGTAENVRKAAEVVQLLSDEKAKLDVVRLPILKAYHPLIAGFNQATIKRIIEETGVKIHIPPPSVDQDEIVVSGEKNGVARAVAELNAIYEEKKITCGELTAQVKKSQHKYVIGPKGKHLQEIMEKTGIVVEVPPSESDSEVLILRGAQPNLVHALTMVYEKANSYVSVTLKIKSWLHKHVIGKAGANIKKIASDYPSVHVKFVEETEAVDIEGPPYEVELVKALLETLSRELEGSLAHAEVKVDPQYHRHLVGRKGATIDKIKAESGAQITIPQSDSNSNIVRIEGVPEAVKTAKAAIEAVVTQLQNSKSIDMIIDKKFHSSLIGPKGATISDIIAKFNGITIQMPDSDADSEIVTVRGDRKDVDAAETYIKKLLRTLEEEKYQIEVPIFRKFHGSIIGKQGANIKKIKEETNTQINVPKDDEGSDLIVVIGRRKDVETARDKLLAIQNELENVEVEEVTVDPRFHASIIGPKGKVVNSVMQEFGVMVHFPQGADKTNKPDKVVVRGPKAAVPKAKARILQLAKEAEANNQTDKITVKREFHRFLIGRAGAFLKQLEADTGCRLVFPTSRVTRGGPGAAAAAAAAAADKAADKEGAAPAAEAPLGEGDIVTIVGRKENIALAKKKIEERVTQLENTIEDSIKVEQKYLKEMMANRGQFLKELGDEFGSVQVNLPRKEGSDEIVLKGLRADVNDAIERIKKFVSDVDTRVTVECHIPYEHFPAIMGQAGKNILKITDEFKVRIKVPERSATSGGDNNKKARKPKAAAGGEEASEEATTPAVEIGAGDAEAAAEAAEAAGAGAEELAGAESSDTPTAVTDGEKEKPKSAEKPIVITGQPEACAKAVEALQALVPVQVSMDIPVQYHRLLIGTKGEDIRELSDKANVRIKFPKSGTDEAVLIRGKPSDIEKAKELIKARMVDLEDVLLKNFKLEVEVDPKYHSSLIGTKGATINEIRSQFDINIDMPRRESATPNIIVLTGYEKDTILARDHILERVKELSSYVTLEIIADPRVRPRIIGQGGRGMRELQDKYGVRLNFPRGDNKDEPVTVTGPEQACEDCREEIEIMAEDFLEDVLEREERREYERPAAKQDNNEKKDQSKEYKVRNAPWNHADQAAFPSLAPAAAAAASAPKFSAWGPKR